MTYAPTSVGWWKLAASKHFIFGEKVCAPVAATPELATLTQGKQLGQQTRGLIAWSKWWMLPVYWSSCEGTTRSR